MNPTKYRQYTPRLTKELNNQVLKNTKKNTEKYRKTTTINHIIHITKIAIQYRPRRHSKKIAFYFRSQRKTRLAITKNPAMFLEKCKWSTAGDVRLSKCRSAESNPVGNLWKHRWHKSKQQKFGNTFTQKHENISTLV